MNRILVTGGAGFVGSHLAMGLGREFPEARVVALDNLKRRGSELNIPRLRAVGVEFIHGDVRNPEDIEAVGEMDLVVECSAEPSVLAGLDGPPSYLINTNLTGTVNCLEAARRHSAIFIFLSTSRVYPIETIDDLALREGNTRYELEEVQPLPGVSARGISEGFPIAGPRSLYGATKLCSELLLTEYIDTYGLRGIINRCGVLTGPWQMGKVDQGVVVLWMARHVFGGDLSYIGYGGTGKQVRDMLHVDDLLRLVTYQVRHIDDLSGQTFNVGGGRDMSASLLELTAMCQEITGKTIDIGRVPETRRSDVRIYITDNTKVHRATGWAPEKSIGTILGDIHRWIDSNADTLRPIIG